MTLNKWFNLSGLGSLFYKMKTIMVSTSLVLLWEWKEIMYVKYLAMVSPPLLLAMSRSITLWNFTLPILQLRQLSRQITRLRPNSYWMELKSKFQGNFPEAELLCREDRIWIELQKTSVPWFFYSTNLYSTNCLDYKSNTWSMCKSRFCRKYT